MKLLAIVVNYRTPTMTLDAVHLLAALEDVPNAEIVVVDNDSQDGSFEILSRGAGDLGPSGGAPVKVIASGRNGGFAYGVNVGARYGFKSKAPPDFFYLLNSDAFPDPSAVRELLQLFEREPRAGIAGSYVYGSDGHPHQTAFRFPTPLSEFERALRLGIASKVLGRWRVPLPLPDEDCEVDWVAGASMMIRREVLEDVGLFDQRFFISKRRTSRRRAKSRGWSTYYVRGSAVAHIGGASTGIKDSRTRRRMPGYWFDSRRQPFPQEPATRTSRCPTCFLRSDFCLVRATQYSEQARRGSRLRSSPTSSAIAEAAARSSRSIRRALRPSSGPRCRWRPALHLRWTGPARITSTSLVSTDDSAPPDALAKTRGNDAHVGLEHHAVVVARHFVDATRSRRGPSRCRGRRTGDRG